MSAQTLISDLSGLTVESIEVVPADSSDTAIYDHGVAECDCDNAIVAFDCDEMHSE